MDVGLFSHLRLRLAVPSLINRVCSSMIVEIPLVGLFLLLRFSLFGILFDTEVHLCTGFNLDSQIGRR